MPKLRSDFPARIDFFVSDEMRCQLITIGYLMGAGGEYATPARNLLGKAMRQFVEGMDASTRKEYDEILMRVHIQEGISEVMRDPE